MSIEPEAAFPCRRCPAEPAAAKLLGVYGQRQEGLFMQRVKVHAGRITIAQWRAVAAIAARYTPDYPLHLTTRQDIELHGIRAADIAAVQAALDAVALTGLGAGGDSLRNVTACPGCGLCAGSTDVSPVADAIREAAESMPWIRDMPRKFKISVSGCKRGCGRPWINDVGLAARKDGAFMAVVGGSLGSRPATGIEFPRTLRPDETVAFAMAALRLFYDQADRKSRATARLRHVRERMGDDSFTARLDDLFEKEKAARGYPSLRPLACDNGFEFRRRLAPPLGDMTPGEALALADAVEKAEGLMRIGFEHDIFVYSRRALLLPADLAEVEDGPRVVACPGAAWCTKGIADSRAAARDVLAEQIRETFSICISGCPNNCSHAAVADVGLAGRIRTIDGERTECYRLLAGGGKGASPALAVELSAAVPAVRAAGVVARLAREYDEARRQGFEDDFGAFVREREDSLRASLPEHINPWA